MKTLLLLLKTRFSNTYNLKKFFKMNKIKLFLSILLAIYVIFSLLTSAFIYANEAIKFLNKFNMGSYMLILFIVVSMLATFMFTIYNAKSNMFNAKDNDLLLSMPIKPSIILGSRLLYIILFNLLISLLIVVPAFVVYIINIDVPISFYLYTFIIFIFSPLIPTIIASIIGYFIAYLTSKTNTKNLFEIILYLGFMASIYYISSKIQDIMTFAVKHFGNINDLLKWSFYPIYLINKILNSNSLWSLIIYIVINIVIIILFTYLLSINFKKIVSNLQENRAKNNYVMHKLKSNSVDKVLYIKELKRYLSSPIYIFNTSFGILLILASSIATFFYSQDQILKALELGTANVGMFKLLVPGLMFVVFVSNTTSASISIESQNFWILKTLPLKVKQIFKGKILVNLTLTIPATIISMAIILINNIITFPEFLILIVLTLLSAFASAFFGLVVNLRFPKLDAQNDVAIVKQSLSVVIATLAPMAIIFGLVGLYSLLSKIISFNIAIILLILFLIVLIIIQYILLNHWGIKRFKEIS